MLERMQYGPPAHHWQHQTVLARPFDFAMICCAAMLIAAPAHAAESQLDSLQDRSVVAESYEQLRQLTDVASASPAETQAQSGDLLISYEMPDISASLRAVVLKPRNNGRQYNIPSPSDSENTFTFLRKHLQSAAEQKASLVNFPLNETLRISPPGSAAHLSIDGFTDAVIDLNGSTLELENVSAGIVISDSQRVTIRNGTLKSPHLLSSIAVTERDASSPAGFRFSVLPEFIAELESQFAATGSAPQLVTVGKAKILGKSWSIDAQGNVDLFTNRGGQQDNFRYESTGSGSSKRGWFTSTSKSSLKTDTFAPGQLVYLLHTNNNGHGIVLKNNDGDVEDISLESIELLNIPGMGIFGEVNRGLHVANVRLAPDPNNPFSFWSTSSDAFHINNNGGDIVVENSYFGGSADDLITVKGNWWKVADVDKQKRSVTVVNADRSYGVHLWAQKGNRLVGIDGSANALGVTRHRDQSERQNSKRHTLLLDDVPTWLQKGVLVANPDLAGGRVVVRNNYLSNSRAQGVLVQTKHVVVENNTFINIAGPGVKLNFSLNLWHEAVNTGNVLVKNNSFENTGVGATKPPYSIYLHEKGVNDQPIQYISAVRIEGNSDTSAVKKKQTADSDTAQTATESSLQDSRQTGQGSSQNVGSTAKTESAPGASATSASNSDAGAIDATLPAAKDDETTENGNNPVTQNKTPLLAHPKPGSTLAGARQWFQLSSNGLKIVKWQVNAGSSVGNDDYYNSGILEGVARTRASGLPRDSSQVHVRIWYQTDEGKWGSLDHEFKADD